MIALLVSALLATPPISTELLSPEATLAPAPPRPPEKQASPDKPARPAEPEKPAGAWGMFAVDLEAGNGASQTAGAYADENLGGAVSQTWYAAPVVDDAAPRSLQPFLQRANVRRAAIGVSAFSIPQPAGGSGITWTGLSAGLSADQYVSEHFALAASVAFARWAEGSGPGKTSPASFGFPVVQLGPALRLGDTRIDLDYRYAPTLYGCGALDVAVSDSVCSTPRGWGDAVLSAVSVVGRKLLLELRASTLPSGASVKAGVGVYLGRDLEAGAAFTWARGEIFSDTNAVYRRTIGEASVSYWFNGSVRGSISYAPQWLVPASGGDAVFEHRLLASFGLRLS